MKFERFTPQTMSSPDRLKAELELIRERGFAMSLEEYTPGVVGLACPLLDARQRVMAAINVVVPASRYAPELQKRVVEDIRRAVGEFNVQMERGDKALLRASSKTS